MKERGFTLIELLVVITVGLVITAMIVGITTTGLKTVRAAKLQQRLHGDALYVTDILSSWMKQSLGFTTSSCGGGQCLKLFLSDGTTKIITSDAGSRLTIDSGDGSGPLPVTNIGVVVCSLTFNPFAHSVQISATLHINTCTDPNSLTFTTTVAQRYAP